MMRGMNDRPSPPSADLEPSATSSRIGRRRSVAREEGGSKGYRKRREEIAEAAVRVFNRLGYERASLSAVAAELDIDRASLYYYIGSKEELFDEVVRTVVERNTEIAVRIRGSDLAPRRKLRELIIALMNSYGQHYPLLYIYIRENLSHVSDTRSDWSQHMRSHNRATEDAMIAIIEEGYANGSFRNLGSARVTAYGILGMLGWTNRWFRPERSEFSVEDIGKTFAELVLGGLETPY